VTRPRAPHGHVPAGGNLIRDAAAGPSVEQCTFRIEAASGSSSVPGLVGRLALVLSVPLPHDLISSPRRSPATIVIAQRAIDQRGKEYQRSEEIYSFQSHRILRICCARLGFHFVATMLAEVLPPLPLQMAQACSRGVNRARQPQFHSILQLAAAAAGVRGTQLAGLRFRAERSLIQARNQIHSALDSRAQRCCTISAQ